MLKQSSWEDLFNEIPGVHIGEGGAVDLTPQWSHDLTSYMDGVTPAPPKSYSIDDMAHAIHGAKAAEADAHALRNAIDASVAGGGLLGWLGRKKYKEYREGKNIAVKKKLLKALSKLKP